MKNQNKEKLEQRKEERIAAAMRNLNFCAEKSNRFPRAAAASLYFCSPQRTQRMISIPFPRKFEKSTKFASLVRPGKSLSPRGNPPRFFDANVLRRPHPVVRTKKPRRFPAPLSPKGSALKIPKKSCRFAPMNKSLSRQT